MSNKQIDRSAEVLIGLVESYGRALLKNRTDEAAAILERIRQDVAVNPEPEMLTDERCGEDDWAQGICQSRHARPALELTDDEILEEYSKHVVVTYCGGVNVLSAMQPEGFIKGVRALLA